jgi:type II secretory pathway pseudopilin PulG
MEASCQFSLKTPVDIKNTLYKLYIAYAILLAMKPATGGYTLLEVLLFLAISSVLLALANVVFSGQGAHTEFMSSTNETASKIQQWVDEVKNGFSASTATSSIANGNLDCTLDGSGNPKLTVPVTNGHATGTNVSCIFLGKAIMVNDKFGAGPKDVNNKIYAYTVLGRRTFDNGGSVVLVDNLLNANPTAAVYDNDGNGVPDSNVNLTEAYTIPHGARVRRVSTAPGGPTANLGAFYADPASSTNSLVAVQYPLSRNIDPVAWTSGAWDIPACINLNLAGTCQKSSAPSNLWPMDTWYICLENTRKNDERALISVISQNGVGASLSVKSGKTDVCD